MISRMHRTLLLIGLLVGVILSPATASAKPKELVVRDANGSRVGVTVGQEFVNDATVALQVSDLTFVVRVARNRFIGNTDALLFESTDCTGEPFLPSPPDFLLPRIAIAAPGQTAYVGGGSEFTITRRSFLFQNACTTTSPAAAQVLSAVVVVDLLDHFTPPFRAILE